MAKKVSRAKAIEAAIDQAQPGDELTIHPKTCNGKPRCGCKTIKLIIGRKRAPVGFRQR